MHSRSMLLNDDLKVCGSRDRGLNVSDEPIALFGKAGWHDRYAAHRSVNRGGSRVPRYHEERELHDQHQQDEEHDHGRQAFERDGTSL